MREAASSSSEPRKAHAAAHSPAGTTACSPSCLGQPRTSSHVRRFLYFYIFQNHFLQKYIFGFTIYRFIPLPPGRGYVIKISVLSNGGPYRLAGGRQAPPNIKTEVPLHLQQTTSIEGKGETWGEGVSCNSETLPDSALVICR